MASGDYKGLPLAWLTTELENWKAAHTALSLNESYSVTKAGITKQLTRADMMTVRQTMRDIQAEIDRQNSVSRPRVSYPDFRS